MFRRAQNHLTRDDRNKISNEITIIENEILEELNNAANIERILSSDMTFLVQAPADLSEAERLQYYDKAASLFVAAMIVTGKGLLAKIATLREQRIVLQKIDQNISITETEHALPLQRESIRQIEGVVNYTNIKSRLREGLESTMRGCNIL